MNDFSVLLFADVHDRSHKNVLLYHWFNSIFYQNIYKRIYELRFNVNFQTYIDTFWIGKFLFIEKSKWLKEKNQFRKNRSKAGERAHVDTENRTMKSAQHDFWSYIYIFCWLLWVYVYYIIVNNTIFFEMTYIRVCVWMWTQ